MDGIGMPQDHIDFAIENGMDALALTDHGNMNGYSHQFFHAKRLKAKGVNFKAIAGIEAYFIDSLEKWTENYQTDKNVKQVAKDKKAALKNKIESTPEDELLLIGDPFAETKNDLVDEETTGATAVENEEETKASKFSDPLKQRNHLVLIPKNREGLAALFKMVSESYTKGFYRYPRVDLDMLKKYSNGNIIAASACIGGRLAKTVFDNQTEPDWEKYGPNDVNFEKIQQELKVVIDGFKWALGEENYYLELQWNSLGAQHLVNMHLIEASKRTNTKLISTADAHYSRPEHWKEREIYKMMGWASKGKEMDASKLPEKIEQLKCELYPKNAEQMWASYKTYTNGKEWKFYDDQLVADSIERTWNIAHEQIGDTSLDTSVKLPSITRLVEKINLGKIEEKLTELKKESSNKEPYTEDDIAFQELKNQCIVGLKTRKFADNQEYIDRLKYELKVIKHLKFSKYFLTYSKVMTTVSKQMLTGVGRGSAAGSLVSYVLGITQVDPIKYNLLFERFLTPHKKGFPDIDSDSGDRDKAVKIIAETFSEENVIPISNFNQLQLRSLIKDLSRLNGVPFDEINKYTKNIENEAKSEAKKTPGFDAQQWVLTYDEAERNSPSFRDLMEKYPNLEHSIKILFRQMRNVSRHAGGIVITENPDEHMPLIMSGGVVQTPWQEGLNFRHLEGFGLLKFDILGLGTLRMFENCIRRILKKQGVKYPTFNQVNKWFYDNLHPDNNNMDDLKVYKNVYWEGNWAGIFQFVQPPVQKFIMKMKPESIVDIATATSIYRPGPLGIGADKMYLKNRANPSKIVYKDPLLKEVLGETCGLVIFQEQLQLIYHKLAGVPLDRTDDVRKAFTKKDISNKEESQKYIKKMREEFASLCLEKNSIEKTASYQIFDEIEKFVSYSFNRSHAVSYAITSYQCAWLSTYFKDEWVATYIDYCATEKGKTSGRESPISIALGESKGLGYKIGKPDINESEAEYQVKDNVLVPSFRALKNVGMPALKEITDYRPYKNLEDLLWNADESWRHSKFNKKAMSTLVKLEAFKSMDLVGEGKTFDNYRQLHHVLVDKADDIKRACTRKKDPRPTEILQNLIVEAKTMPDWTLEERIQHSQELSGSVDINMIVTADVREYLDTQEIGSIDEWNDEESWYWCIVKNTKVAQTKTGKPYLRMSIYGESGQERGCFIWGYNPNKDKVMNNNTLVIAKFKNSDFGLSTFFSKLEVLERT
jgi:DNA-directed DNA polymerase III PolC